MMKVNIHAASKEKLSGQLRLLGLLVHGLIGRQSRSFLWWHIDVKESIAMFRWKSNVIARNLKQLGKKNVIATEVEMTKKGG